jgi:NADH-quinone oxidoreductase subunit N
MITFLPEHYLIFNIFLFLTFFILNNLSIKHSFPKLNVLLLLIILFINLLILIFCDYSFNNIYFNNLFIKSNYTQIISTFLILFSLFIIIPIINFNKNIKIDSFEYYIILLIAISALLLILSSKELISFYFLLEIQSISFYILAAYNKKNKKSIESGIKYFILSTFSSIFVLIGIALLYSISGLMSFIDLNLFFTNEIINTSIIYLSLISITTSFLFKLYIAPFHFWISDIYQGSPLSSVTIFSVLPQIIFYSVYFIILKYVFKSCNIEVSYLFITLVILTTIIGIVFALYQNKLKKVIAYSSIINIGYVIINFYYNNNIIFLNSLLFIIIYMFNLITFFAILLNIYDKKNNIYLDNLVDFNGFYKIQKEISILLIICLFSLAGIPFFSLFYGKLLIITSLFTQSSYLLIFFLIIITCISSLVYLRIIKNITYKNKNKWLYIKPINYFNSFLIVQLILFHIYYGFNLQLLSTSIYHSILCLI